MGTPLAEFNDVQVVFPSLTDSDQTRIAALIVRASALLRQKAPWVDERIARFAVNPDDPGGLDPVTVADVVSTMIKRFLANPLGATNQSETVGPYSTTQGYALRGDKDVRGELLVTDTDIDKLRPATVTEDPWVGTIRTRSAFVGAGCDGVGVLPVDRGFDVSGAGWVTPPP